jgi:hypothetical protein
MFFILSASECVLTPSRARCIPMQAEQLLRAFQFALDLLKASYAAVQPHGIPEDGFAVNQTESGKVVSLSGKYVTRTRSSHMLLYRTA